jgi:hypothetical protein
MADMRVPRDTDGESDRGAHRGVQNVDADQVASWLGWGRPELAGKAHRRSTWALDLTVAHGHLIPGCEQATKMSGRCAKMRGV